MRRSFCLILIAIFSLTNLNCSSNWLREKKILNTLDNSNDGYYSHFIWLEDAYSYLIDTRCNIYRGENGDWAIVAERLGFNPRGGNFILDLYYYGNCLVNQEVYNSRLTNTKYFYPVDFEEFDRVFDIEYLKSGIKELKVRDKVIPISQNENDYKSAGIELHKTEFGNISAQDVGRLLILNHQDIFRATDEELYSCLPNNLKKILIIDEWYHKDYLPEYDNPNQGFETVVEINNKPSSYETWQQIARVIATGDTSHYKPTLPANTHWSYYPESGSL